MLRPRFGFVLALALAFGLLPAALPSAAPADEEARPYVVKVHADWCGTCRKIMPVWTRIEEEYGERVRLVVFDVTDRERLEVARRDAERDGLLEFFDAYKAKTGVIAVIDGATRQPIRVLKGETDFARYETEIERALGS
jgi:thiol-disulfide isomerase/thioredoxin